MKNFFMLFVIVFIVLTVCLGCFLDYEYEDNDDNLIANTTLGNAYLHGPYGNVNASNKIAIIVGVHPLENNSHSAVVNFLEKMNQSLNNSYYIYMVNVTKDSGDFDKSRLNGQIIARDHVVPDINRKNYVLVVDFHAHRGVYEENHFILSPLNDNTSKSIGLNIIKNIDELNFLNFTPEDDGHPTSPNYVTIPIINNGTPALIYETPIDEPNNLTYGLIGKFILNLDNIRNFRDNNLTLIV